MKVMDVVIGVLAVLLLTLIVVLIFVVIAPGFELARESSPPTFMVTDSGTAGNYSYAVFSYRGEGNVTALVLTAEPKQKITIINDPQAVQATRFNELVDQIKELEKYGYTVNVSSNPKINEGINVIPSGAFPSYALFNIQQNTSTSTIVYIGASDLLLSNGIKQLDWYATVPRDQLKRLMIYNSTPDDLLNNHSVSISHDILYTTWALHNSSITALSDGGTRSVSLGLNGSRYMRIIYELGTIYGIYDLPPLIPPPQVLTPIPESVYPWEKSDLKFSLNKTNGTAFFTIKKDAKVISHAQLRRVTDANVFIEKLAYESPGEYVLIVSDNSGVIAGGLLHVKDLRIQLAERRGPTCVFSVTVDGEPLENAEATIWLGNSSDRRRFFISQGLVTVNAKLEKGTNTFNFDISDTTLHVQVENQQEALLDFYVKYGVPGLLAVMAVYFSARMTRRPSYKLRFDDSTSYIRQEIQIPTDNTLVAFRNVRRDMKLEGSPITPQEFTIALKRYITNGADVTEGNVEETLKKLEKAGHLESHRDYYQLKGEGDVRRNALMRMIREKLIENGTAFEERDGKFITMDFEIGFFGTIFKKKAVIVVDGKPEIKRILSSLSEQEQARLRVLQSNDMLLFVTIDRLSDIL